MKILITGGSGFTGGHLAKWCANENHEVHICDNNSRGKNDEFITDLVDNNQVVVKVLDLTRKEEVNSLPKDYDIVFHLAAINGTENFYKRPIEVMDVGVLGIINVFKYCAQMSIPKVVVASSAKPVCCFC